MSPRLLDKKRLKFPEKKSAEDERFGVLALKICAISAGKVGISK
jgi:hypothetical protein